MKIRFFTRFKNNPQTIFVRVYHSKDFDFTVRTGIVVLKNDFSNAYEQLKPKASTKNSRLINDKLNALRTHLFDCYNETIMADNDFHKNWLKEKVDKFFNYVQSSEEYKKYFVDWARYYNENETTNKDTGLPLSIGTLKKYNTGLNCLISFEDYSKKRILLNSISYDFYKDFTNYCLNEKKYTRNTTGVHIKTVKLWLNEANKRGFCNVDFSEFKSMTNETKDIYLTSKELTKIYKHDFSENPRLSNVRDLLIIGCYTALRVSDFMRLKLSDISNDKIEIKTKKTAQTVLIPLHKYIKEIIKRNNGNLPRSISDQKFNKYVKEVCKEAGITELAEGGRYDDETKRKKYGFFPKYELVASHTCRRSFASNLYGKLDNSTIMAITGHKTEKEFLKYIKITPKQHAEKLKAHWDNQ
ncbi:site-specific integrase [Winogradskyella forsetii]|uniref:site-specific integrase n=1 Tax=Winogradskyella forsetii TaxID=2686077 RepID=UPI0015BBCC9E|nr:site-specific integrase [Winogradskyella forsetii]